MFTAHIRKYDNKTQSVGEHCRNTAFLAEHYLTEIGLGNTGYLLGLFHDMGKLIKAFDDYIKHLSDAVRGSIDHSYAGAKYLFEKYASDAHSTMFVVMLGHIIMSHHGLHDWITEDGHDYFTDRVSKNETYDEAVGDLNEIIADTDIDRIFKEACVEYYDIAAKLSSRDSYEIIFGVGMLERLMQSTLIDADRTDTAKFMSGREDLFDNVETNWDEMLDRLNEKLDAFRKKTDVISKQRMSISDRCAAFADHNVGICRLIVPTGGGKTLSSLRFALNECRNFGNNKIIYVAPFMSILEQNSDAISEICGKDNERKIIRLLKIWKKANVLEHYSDAVTNIDDAELWDYQLYTEKWNSPVITTTMVQFLNTLFSADTACVRRMHALCGSVIIIDEIQSIPLRCVTLFNSAMNFLKTVCNCTVVLCSATQPVFDKLNRGIIFDQRSDMIEDYDKDFEIFKRAELVSKVRPNMYDFDEAAEFCVRKFDENGDMLCIVNTKKQALEMFRRLREQLEGKAYVIHLSTNMCPANARTTHPIRTIRQALEDKERIIVSSTQLIEAGVDISFGCVVRALAGLDNAAQAAGRCNRNGEKGHICPVYIINFKDEQLGSLESMRNAKTVSRQIIQYYADSDLLSVGMQNMYFERLFDSDPGALEYKAERTTLFNMLSLNKSRRNICKGLQDDALGHAFKTAGSIFRVIESNTLGVIVPYDKKAVSVIEKLKRAVTPDETTKLLRQAQRYFRLRMMSELPWL